MKIKEMKMLNDEELNSRLAELNKELMKDNAQIALGAAPKNPGKVGAVKRNIARIKTILNARKERNGAAVKVKGNKKKLAENNPIKLNGGEVKRYV